MTRRYQNRNRSLPALARAGLAALCLAGAAQAESVPPSDGEARARAVVEQTADAVLAVLRDDALSLEEQRRRIQALAYDRFDFETISKLVLAKNWPRFTPEQRSEFVSEFKRHISLTYGKSFDGYENETVEILGTRAEGNGDVTVRSQIKSGRPEPYLIDYRLRAKGDDWLLIDVIVERVSLISNFRSQTQEIISKEGPEGVIRLLKQKNAEREKAGQA